MYEHNVVEAKNMNQFAAMLDKWTALNWETVGGISVTNKPLKYCILMRRPLPPMGLKLLNESSN